MTWGRDSCSLTSSVVGNRKSHNRPSDMARERTLDCVTTTKSRRSFLCLCAGEGLHNDIAINDRQSNRPFNSGSSWILACIPTLCDRREGNVISGSELVWRFRRRLLFSFTWVNGRDAGEGTLDWGLYTTARWAPWVRRVLGQLLHSWVEGTQGAADSRRGGPA